MTIPMKHFNRIALAAACAVSLCGAVSQAVAHSFEKGTLKISHPWSRETPQGAKVAGGFLKVTNSGKEADRLVGGSFVASKRIEIHEMAMEGGMMKMRELPKGLEIKPGETVELKPGSFHMMFMELEKPFKAGDLVKGTLVFEKAGTIDVEYKIEPLGAKSSDDHSGHGASAKPADAKQDHSKMKH